jgi:hypothetical protein
VQTCFVLLTIEVCPPQLENSSVVPPEEEAHCGLDEVCHNYPCPKLRSEDVLRRELHQRGDTTPLLVERRSSYNADRNKYAEPKYCDHAEDVADHTHEP